MKLPLIRQTFQQVDPQKLETTLEVLEIMAEARGLSEQELDVIGELITIVCGALEVHQLVADGKRESEALNLFAQKVMGSIDR